MDPFKVFILKDLLLKYSRIKTYSDSRASSVSFFGGWSMEPGKGRRRVLRCSLFSYFVKDGTQTTQNFCLL